MSRRLSDKDKSRIIELRNQGLSYSEIGIEVGCCYVSARRICDPGYAAIGNKRSRERQRTPEVRAAAAKFSKTPEYRDKKNSIQRSPKSMVRERDYRRNRYATDIQFRLQLILRNRLRTAITGGYKSGSAVSDLGCTIAEFRVYLEKQFLPGMSWENHSRYGWHIDHIRPLSSFDLTDREQLLEACNYTNMQPLWAIDNLEKSKKLAVETTRQLALLA